MVDGGVIFAGFGVGLLVGMTGIGGGALMTPILVLVLGAPIKAAIATDLVFAAVTKIFGLAIHRRFEAVDWGIVKRLSIGSLPAAAVTGVSFHYAAEWSESFESAIFQLLGGILVLTALSLVGKPWLHRIGRNCRVQSAEVFKRYQGVMTVIAGMLMGVVVTATSVGAGAFGAVLLLFLYPLRLTPAKLVGTDIAHAVPLAIVAGFSHLVTGSVDYLLLINLLAGSIPGVLVGARGTHSIPDGWLRNALAVVLLASAWKLLFHSQ